MKKLVLVLSLALLFGVAVQANAQTATTLPSASAITTSLAIGSQGDSVTALQQFLIAKGYLSVAAPTGLYGNMTAQAVSSFQAANNLPQVGRVGPKTIQLLQQLLGGGQQQAPSPEQPSMGNGGNSQTLPPGCLSTAGYSPINGQPCNSGSQITSTLPPGCLSTSGYSSTTGQPCNGSQVTTLPPGCVSASGYSTTTGQPCNPTTSGLCPNGDTEASNCTQAPEQQQNADTVITSPSSDPVSANNTTATLTGQWPGDIAGTSAVGWFNYGTSSTDLSQSTSQVALASFASNQGIFSASISNLQPNTTYYYEVEVAIQPEGMGDDVNGLVVSFTTSGTGITGVSPSMNTMPETVGNYGSYSATPSGQFVGTWPSTGEGWINYGTSSTLAGALSSNITYFQNITSMDPSLLFTGIISGLQSGTTYYYQACGTTSQGSAQICGSIDSFTTTGAPSGGLTGTTSTSSSSCNIGGTPSITLLSPNGGETYTAGQQVPVTWTTSNISSSCNMDVVLRYQSSPGDYYSDTILPNASTPNTGSATVTIPTSSNSSWFTSGAYSAPFYGNYFQMFVTESGDYGNPQTTVPEGNSASNFTILQ